MNKDIVMVWIVTIIGIVTFFASSFAGDYIMGEFGVKIFDDELNEYFENFALDAVVLLSCCISWIVGRALYFSVQLRDDQIEFFKKQCIEEHNNWKKEKATCLIVCSGLLLFLIQRVIIFHIFGDIRSNSILLGNMIDIAMAVGIFYLCRFWYNSRSRKFDKPLE